MKKGYHKTKDGRTVKKGLYYYMNDDIIMEVYQLFIQ